MSPLTVLIYFIDAILNGMSQLIILPNVSLLSVLTISMIMTIVISIVKGVIRHNGNS